MGTRRLKGICEFTDDDLASNRAGFLTDAQRNRMAKDHRRGHQRAVVLIPVFTLLTIYFGWISYQSLPNPSAYLGFIVAAIFALMVGVMMYYAINGPTALGEDIDKGTVSTLFGKAEKQAHEVYVRSKKEIDYKVAIGTLNLGSVPAEIFHFFEQDQCYHVYLLPRTQKIVSVERVDCFTRKPILNTVYIEGISSPPTPTKQPSSLLHEIEAAMVTKALQAILSYQISGGAYYKAEIQWQQEGSETPRTLWRAQSTDKGALAIQVQEQMGHFLGQFGRRGWRVLRESGEAPSTQITVRKIYALERQKEVSDAT